MHKLALSPLNPSSFIVAIVLVFLASRALASPGGELDPTFGDHGRIIYQGADSTFSGTAYLQPTDGKLLFAGTHSRGMGGSDFAVLRVNSDGSADQAFGTLGIVIIELSNDANATKVAVQPDGKILIAGSARTGSADQDFALARLNADGTLDSTFGKQGRVTLDLGGTDDILTDIELLENGQIVVVGKAVGDGIQSAAFARFEMDGSLDTSFGTGPIAGATIVPASNKGAVGYDEPFIMTRQPDGKLVACGSYVRVSNGFDYFADMMAIRINTDGSLDVSFGTNGVSRTTTGRGGAMSCVAMPDGHLLVGGQGGTRQATLVRLTPEGAMDPTFGAAGVAAFNVGVGASSDTIVLLGDGSVAVGGRTWPLENTDEPTDVFVARIDPDSGSLDSTFGDKGITIVTSGYLGRSSVNWSTSLASLVTQADRIFVTVASSHDGSLAVARVNPAGTGSQGFAGFVSTTATVDEDAGTVAVTVRRTGGSTGILSVDYTTSPNTATPPGDFTSVSGTLTWQSGDMDPKTITVPITKDATGEPTERFTVVLSNSTGGLAASVVSVDITDSQPADSGAGNSASGGGGGGGLGFGALTALALISAMATYRRRRNAVTGRSRAH